MNNGSEIEDVPSGTSSRSDNTYSTIGTRTTDSPSKQEISHKTVSSSKVETNNSSPSLLSSISVKTAAAQEDTGRKSILKGVNGVDESTKIGSNKAKHQGCSSADSNSSTVNKVYTHHSIYPQNTVTPHSSDTNSSTNTTVGKCTSNLGNHTHLTNVNNEDHHNPLKPALVHSNPHLNNQPKLILAPSTSGGGGRGGYDVITTDANDLRTKGKEDPIKSKRFLNHWKSAASMSKLGNRTKSILGKFKPHSHSVDMVAGSNTSR